MQALLQDLIPFFRPGPAHDDVRDPVFPDEGDQRLGHVLTLHRKDEAAHFLRGFERIRHPALSRSVDSYRGFRRRPDQAL